MTSSVDGIRVLNAHLEIGKNINSKQYLFSNGIMGKIRNHLFETNFGAAKSCRGDVQKLCSDEHITGFKECEQNNIKNCIVY